MMRYGTCSTPEISSAILETATLQLISADPPPYTMRWSLIRFRTTHMASWRERFASSTIICIITASAPQAYNHGKQSEPMINYSNPSLICDIHRDFPSEVPAETRLFKELLQCP